MSLTLLRQSLHSLPDTAETYQVPTLWDRPFEPPSVKSVSPKKYYSDVIDKILATPEEPIVPVGSGEWTKFASIYNLFVRTTTAFDHDGKGQLDIGTESGFRDTGTFLKSIALLPYIKTLGANAVHLLPITAIGKDGNKGTLGSPYAIKNPYKLDERLAEPALKLDVETEFKAFTEACHHLGLRVVVEFVFRTAAKDGDWVKEHPEWFYWIDEKVENREGGSADETRYGNPVFTEKELITIISQVELKNFTHLPEPHEGYRQMFTAVPQTVEMINGRYIGTTADGQTCRIPGAFADWPPQDTQPPWGDVTYLRMYTHPDFNYIAYNTIRMYASQLVSDAFINRPLWDAIAGIIPHYQKTFGIDGVMIDMGHALPSELKREMVAAARSFNSDFAFWDENFSVSKKSRDENYNAVIGNLALILHRLPDLKTVLKNLAVMDVPIPFFAAAESHNTPRVSARFAGEAGMNFSKVVAALGSVLPAVPFIHSGFELGERFPINTGIGFAADELGGFPSEKLPLFSTYSYKWAGGNETPPIISYLVKLAAARKKYLEVITNPDADSMAIIDLENPNIIAVLRKAAGTTLLYLGNFNPNAAETASVPVRTTKTYFTDAINDVNVPIISDKIELVLKAGESVLLEV